MSVIMTEIIASNSSNHSSSNSRNMAHMRHLMHRSNSVLAMTVLVPAWSVIQAVHPTDRFLLQRLLRPNIRLAERVHVLLISRNQSPAPFNNLALPANLVCSRFLAPRTRLSSSSSISCRSPKPIFPCKQVAIIHAS